MRVHRCAMNNAALESVPSAMLVSFDWHAGGRWNQGGHTPHFRNLAAHIETRDEWGNPIDNPGKALEDSGTLYIINPFYPHPRGSQWSPVPGTPSRHSLRYSSAHATALRKALEPFGSFKRRRVLMDYEGDDAGELGQQFRRLLIGSGLQTADTGAAAWRCNYAWTDDPQDALWRKPPAFLSCTGCIHTYHGGRGVDVSRIIRQLATGPQVVILNDPAAYGSPADYEKYIDALEAASYGNLAGFVLYADPPFRTTPNDRRTQDKIIDAVWAKR